MKVVLNILVTVAIVVLAYMCIRSILDPIEFDKEKTRRENAIIERLVAIRKAQNEYKNVHKENAGSFEDLIGFLKNERLPFVIKDGVLTDEQLEAGMTELEAVQKGLIRRDTNWVNAGDTLFGRNYPIDELRYVPNTDNVQFTMDTTTLTSGSGYTVKVFEAGVLYDDYLHGLDPQQVANLKDRAEKLDRYPGLRVGSLTEINNSAGNWE